MLVRHILGEICCHNGQESKLRKGRVSGRIGVWYEISEKEKYFFSPKRQIFKPSTLTNYFLTHLLISVLFSLQVFLIEPGSQVVALTPSPLPSAVSVLMEKRGEETGTTGTMMGSSAIIGRSKEGGRGRLLLLWQTITFCPGSQQHFLIIAHLHVSLDVKLQRSLQIRGILLIL